MRRRGRPMTDEELNRWREAYRKMLAQTDEGTVRRLRYREILEELDAEAERRQQGIK